MENKKLSPEVRLLRQQSRQLRTMLHSIGVHPDVVQHFIEEVVKDKSIPFDQRMQLRMLYLTLECAATTKNRNLDPRLN